MTIFVFLAAGGAPAIDAAALSVVPASDEEVTELTKAWVQAGKLLLVVVLKVDRFLYVAHVGGGRGCMYPLSARFLLGACCCSSC